MTVRSFAKKAIALTIALMMVLSVASVAFAANNYGYGTVTVKYKRNGGSLVPSDEESNVYESDNYYYTDITLPGADKAYREGYTLSGWKLRNTVYAPAETVKGIPVSGYYNRYHYNWNDLEFTAQWKKTENQGGGETSTVDHCDVRFNAYVTLTTKVDGVVTETKNYNATIDANSVSATLNGVSLGSFSVRNSEVQGEREAHASFSRIQHSASNKLTVTVTLKVNMDGVMQNVTFTHTFSESELLQAIQNCGMHSGYDFIINASQLTELSTCDVTFKTEEGGKINNQTSDIVQKAFNDSVWEGNIDVPITTPDNGYEFLGWYDESDKKVTSFPETVTEDLVYTAKWQKKTATENVYNLYYMTKPEDMTGIVWPANITGSATLTADMLNLGTASKIGASFDGWYLFNAGSKCSTLTEANYKELAASPKEELKLVNGEYKFVTTHTYEARVYGSFSDIAEEIENYYTVIYMLDGKAVTMTGYSMTEKELDSAPTELAPAPAVKNGYKFNGWKINNTTVDALAFGAPTVVVVEAGEGTGKITKNYYSVTVTGTTEQQFKDVYTYELTYVFTDTDPSGVNAKPATTSDVKNNASEISLQSVSVKEGYTFGGWKQNGSVVNNIDWGEIQPKLVSTVLTNQGTESAPDWVFVRTYSYTASVTGTITKNDTASKYEFIVNYYVNGKINNTLSDSEILDENESTFTLADMPTIAKGYEYINATGANVASWMNSGLTAAITTLDWASVTATASETTVNKAGLWETTYTKTIDCYAKTAAAEQVDVYNLTLTNGANVATKTGTGSANAPKIEASDSKGFAANFTGWNPSNITVNDYQKDGNNVRTYDAANNKVTYTQQYKASAVAQYADRVDAYIFNVTYTVSGTTNSTLTARNTGLSSAPSIEGKLANTETAYFDGWKLYGTVVNAIDWSSITASVSSGFQGDKYVTTYTKSIELTGSFVKYAVENYYKVTYKVDGNIVDDMGYDYTQFNAEPTKVTLEAAAYTPANGYTFSGWTASDFEMATNSGLVEAEKTIKNYYEATVTGTTEKQFKDVSTYELTYVFTDTDPSGVNAKPATTSGVKNDKSAITVQSVDVKSGYTFSGWNQGNTKVTGIDDIDWTEGTPVTATVATLVDGNWVFVRTTPYTASVAGEITKNGSVTTNVYTVNYFVNGALNGSATDSDSSKLSLKEVPVGTNEEKISGWTNAYNTAITTLDWVNEATLDTTGPVVNNDGKWETVNTYTINCYAVVASVENVNVYTLTFTGPEGATLPAAKTGSAVQTIADTDTAALTGSHFIGWNPAEITSGSYTEVGTAEYSYDAEANKVTYTHKLAASTEAQFAGIESVYLFNVTYTVSGIINSTLTARNTGLSSAPSIEGKLANTADQYFTGWMMNGSAVSSINWSEIDATDDGGKLVGGKWVVTYTKSAELTGSFTDFGMEKKSVYNLYFDVDTAKGEAKSAMLNCGETPTFGDATALAGFRFDGWNPASISWGEPTETTETGTTTKVTTYTYECTLTARFKAVASSKVYTLYYVLYDSGVEDADKASIPVISDETGSSEIAPSAAPNLDGYNFLGWSAVTYTQVGEPDVTIDAEGREITTTYYEATTVGSFSKMAIEDVKTLYTLRYEGFVDGAQNWPSDVERAETAPELAGAPTLANYTFLGWNPASLDWSGASVKVEYEYTTVTEDADGNPITPYLERTAILNVTVVASFTENEAPVGPTEPDPEPIPLNPVDPFTTEEIPLSAPATGSAELIGTAAVLAASALAITLGRSFRKKADDEQEAEDAE